MKIDIKKWNTEQWNFVAWILFRDFIRKNKVAFRKGWQWYNNFDKWKISFPEVGDWRGLARNKVKSLLA